jgi:hypothetical protein
MWYFSLNPQIFASYYTIVGDSGAVTLELWYVSHMFDSLRLNLYSKRPIDFLRLKREA